MLGDKNNQTPLHIAAKSGAMDCVRLLVSRCADVEARDKWRKTPLIAAAASGCHDVCVWLVESAGASLSANDMDEHTPEDEARRRGHDGVAYWLFSASRDASSKAKQTAARARREHNFQSQLDALGSAGRATSANFLAVGPSFTTDEFTAWMNVLGFQDFVKDACTIEFQDLFKFTEDELAACFLVDDHSAPAKCLQVLRLHRCMHPTVYARHSSELAKKLHEAGFQQFLPKLHGLVLADLGCMQRHELIAALASSPRERAAVTQMHRLLQKWGNSGSHVPPVAGATARSGAGGDAGAGASASGSGGAEASSQPAWVPRSGVAVPTAEVPEQHIRMGAFTIVKQAYPDPNSQPELDKDPDVHRVLIANYGGRKVALKVFPPSAREQARREAAVLVELHRRHFPGAVQLQGDFVDEKYGSCFLVLEYGKYTLRDFVRAVRRETASWKDRLMTLMQELAGILERLHGLGYAHNDLKPDNIMMFGTTTSTPKLIDWENATQIGEPFPYSGDRFRCSVEYAAPEVLKGTAGLLTTRAQADMFAFGLIVAEIFNDNQQQCFLNDRERWECLYTAPTFAWLVDKCRVPSGHRSVLEKIERLLKSDPTSRSTAAQLQFHASPTTLVKMEAELEATRDQNSTICRMVASSASAAGASFILYPPTLGEVDPTASDGGAKWVKKQVKLLRKSLSRQDLSAAHQSGPAAAVAASSRTMPMVVNCVCHGPWLGDPGTKCSPPLHPGWKVALTGVEIKRVLDVMHTTGELFLKAARTSVPTFMPTYGAQAQFMGDYLHAFVRAARAELNMEHEEVESCDLWDNLVRISKSHGDTVRSWLSRVNHHGLTPTTCGDLKKKFLGLTILERAGMRSGELCWLCAR